MLFSYANWSDYASGSDGKIIEGSGRKIAADGLRERKKTCPGLLSEETARRILDMIEEALK